jgi:dihydrodipicolinate synthase/N-acetylneuraminate lyase
MRSLAAQEAGAAIVMIMPPFFGATLTVAGPGVIEYVKTVAGAIDIPVMVQDAPPVADAAAGQPGRYCSVPASIAA